MRMCCSPLLAVILVAACADSDPSKDDAAAGGTPSTKPLRIGDACKGRMLPERSSPLPQVVGPSTELLPDGAVRPIDAGDAQPDPRLFPGTPICLIDATSPEGYFTATCELDRDCPSGGYCDTAGSAQARLSHCLAECRSDDDCGGRLCCGESTPLSCVEEDGVHGCRCDVECRRVYPFDGGPPHDEPSTCGRCDFWCCGEACLNLANDDRNCGACGHVCGADLPYCDNGKCSAPECSSSPGAPDASMPACEQAQCCGATCCQAGSRCCGVPGPNSINLQCQPSTEPCPMGCVTCMCASPDTLVDTPDGERAIERITPGDLVFSLEAGERVIVPVLRVNRTPVPATHAMVQVTLASGRVIAMSPGHPTADGRTFADLAPGERLGTLVIDAVQLVPYTHSFTVDILPASTTGVYFASGAPVGSTLLR